MEPAVPEQIITERSEFLSSCAYLATRPVLAFDTEFVGEDSYHPRLCLVQVATPDRLILIDPLSLGALDEFWNLLVGPERTVVVHAGREEVRLCRLWTGRTPEKLFDLQIAAGLVGLPYPLGHGALVKAVLGIQLTKSETLTEWRDRPLTQQQIRYAFDDVRYLFRLWQHLSDRLRELGREEWAREEFARLVASSSPEEGAVEKWRKLRGIGSLDRRRLAIVRELHRWREETAARTNRPARAIVRDDLLIEIARRNPARDRELSVIRGLPKRNVAPMLQVIHRARSLPLQDCPVAADREQDPPQVPLITSVLTAVLGDFCGRHKLAPNLVASSQDLRLLVRGRLAGQGLPSDSLLTHGWRSVHILPELQAFLDGQRYLRIQNIAAETPFGLSEVKSEPGSSA
jgi:ribonuclease D